MAVNADSASWPLSVLTIIRQLIKHDKQNKIKWRITIKPTENNTRQQQKMVIVKEEEEEKEALEKEEERGKEAVQEDD